MINTVSQNYKKDNPFDLVSKRPQQSNSYWLQSQNTIQNPDIVEINNKEEKKLSIPKIQILTPEEARKTNWFINCRCSCFNCGGNFLCFERWT